MQKSNFEKLDSNDHRIWDHNIYKKKHSGYKKIKKLSQSLSVIKSFSYLFILYSVKLFCQLKPSLQESGYLFWHFPKVAPCFGNRRGNFCVQIRLRTKVPPNFWNWVGPSLLVGWCQKESHFLLGMSSLISYVSLFLFLLVVAFVTCVGNLDKNLMKKIW